MMRNNSEGLESPMSRERHHWFITEMGKKRQAYTRDKKLTMFAGTWNVNGRAPEPAAEIDKWVFPVEHEGREPFDLYMLGLQEVQALSGVDAVRTDPNKGLQWRERVQHILGSDYERIAERQLVGIMVMVFLRKNHTPYLSNVQLSYAATGFLNAVGNKGGVAARFQLYDRTISCVACHLAAHVDFVERRNQDFKDVVRKAVFLPVESPEYSQNAPTLRKFPSDLNDIFPSKRSLGDRPNSSLPGLSSSSAGSGPGQWLGSVASVAATAFSDMSAGANAALLNDPNAVKILEHDVIFWLGDLNYRIEASFTDVMEWIRKENWRELYQADQLQRQMKECDIFRGFQEGPIRFPPTYKLHRFEDGYKLAENEDQQRIPSYTDRILWRIGDSAHERILIGKPRIKLIEYTSARVLSSDHRPVYASFEMVFGVEDVERRLRVEEKVNQDLDDREASLRPSLQLSSSTADFGDVFFEQDRLRTVSLKNVGSTTAFVTIAFPPSAPDWLKLKSSAWRSVEIAPEQSVDINLSIFISARRGTANQVAQSGCMLNTNVDVTAEPGNLHERIKVRGRYVATTLGLSLETLSMLERPVLALRNPRYQLDGMQSNLKNRDADYERGAEPGIVPRPIPKELWLLIDALLKFPEGSEHSYGSIYPGLFREPGEDAETQRVLALIDRAEPVPQDLSARAIATCLIQILRNLDEPVIPSVLYRRALEAGHTEEIELVSGVLEMLPPLNANVFWYIIGFLCESSAVREASDGRKEIAAIFGDVLLRTEVSNPRERRYKTAFMLGAFHIHQRVRRPVHRAIFDLSTPASHPRRIVGDLAAGR